ncbi:MAG TPA: FKBP-type peptidyl-prolyl cis-trans isomerase [Planctomycetota bacterium]|nr:FKBP-type peptidyl-prolyl cis-trans isomerase [Planctomycetota bacterium]
MPTARVILALLACGLPPAACGDKPQQQELVDATEGQPADAASTPAAPAPATTRPAGGVPPSGDPDTRTDPAYYLPADSELTTTPSGLKYLVLREGSGTPPTPGGRFTAHYCGWYTSGEVFDSSYSRNEPLSYPVSQMIPGWQEALVMMKPGSEYILVVTPELGYGVAGGNGIPPDSTLVFRMELLSVSG